MQPARDPHSDNSAALAADLHQQCRRMADGLRALEAAPAAELEASVLASIEDIRLLQSQISAAAAGLGFGLRTPASPPPWPGADAGLAEAARLLGEAAAICSRLTGKALVLREDISQRLLALQRGARVLRSYAATASASGPQ